MAVQGFSLFVCVDVRNDGVSLGLSVSLCLCLSICLSVSLCVSHDARRPVAQRALSQDDGNTIVRRLMLELEDHQGHSSSTVQCYDREEDSIVHSTVQCYDREEDSIVHSTVQCYDREEDSIVHSTVQCYDREEGSIVHYRASRAQVP